MKEISRKQLLVISALTLLLLVLISILVPVLIDQNIDDKTIQKVRLNSETLNNWSVMPGSLGIHNNKRFKLFSLQHGLTNPISLQSLQHQLNYQDHQQYDQLTLLSNTNASIQFVKKQTHISQNSGNQESQIIRQINLNVIKGFYEEQNSDLGRLYLQDFQKVFDFLENEWAPAHISRLVYIKNNLQDFNSLKPWLEAAQITDPQLQKNIYEDKEYGFQNINGLSKWVRQTMNLQDEQKYDKYYYLIQNKFQLTSSMMNAMVDKSSNLYSAIYFGVFFDCLEWGIVFDQTDIKQSMAYKQWSSQYFSKLGGCSALIADPYDNSFDILDSSNVPFKSSLELSYITGMELEDSTLQSILLNKQKGLFNIKYLRYLLDSSNSNQNIKAFFQIDSSTSNEFIYKIREYLEQAHKYVGLYYDPTTKQIATNQQRAIAFLTEKALNYQFQKLQTVLLVSLLQEYVYLTVTDQQTKTDFQQCEKMFINIDSFRNKVCQNQSLNFVASKTNMKQWAQLYLDQKDSQLYKDLLAAGVAEKDIGSLYSGNNLFGSSFGDVNEFIIGAADCQKIQKNMLNNGRYCDPIELGLKEWGKKLQIEQKMQQKYEGYDFEGYKKLNRQQFIQKANNANYQTVEVDIDGYDFDFDKMYFKQKIDNKIVEYSDIIKQLIEFKKGGEISQIYDYYRNLIIDVVFQGLYCEMEVGNFLWKQDYYYVQFMKNYEINDGGYKYKLDQIELQVKDNDQLNQQLQDLAFQQINSGIQDISRVKSVQKMYGQTNISYCDALDDGQQLNYVVKTSDASLEGTDGNQFQPFLDVDSSLKYYNQYLNKVVGLGKGTEDEQNIKYRVDFETTGLQKQSKLDLIVSDINSQDVGIDAAVKVDNKQYDSLKKYQQSFYEVNKRTGLTIQKQENYQYTLKIERTELLSHIIDQDISYPLFNMYLDYGLDSGKVDEYMHSVNKSVTTRKCVLIVFITFSVVWLLIFLVLYKVLRTTQQQENEQKLINVQ